MKQKYTELTTKTIEHKIKNYNKKYDTPKWLSFCKKMSENGFAVKLHEAKTTFSKYVRIEKNDKKVKIRFSNHRPNYHTQKSNDSDYYVGISHSGCITTEQLVEEIELVYEQKFKEKRKMNEKQELLKEWIKHKKAEDKAKASREEVAEKLRKLYPIEGEKKSQTFKEDGFDIEIKKSVKVDVNQKEADHLTETFKDAAPFKNKYTLDSALYKALESVNESFYKRCSQAVTFTPGKPSVKVVKK